MLTIKQLFLLATCSLMLTSPQQSQALKKTFRVRDNMQKAEKKLRKIIVVSFSPILVPVMLGLGGVEAVAAALLSHTLKHGNIRSSRFLCSCIYLETLYDDYYKKLLHEILAKAKDNCAYSQCVDLWIKTQDNITAYSKQHDLYTKNREGEHVLDIAFRRKLSKIAIQLIKNYPEEPMFNKRNDTYSIFHYATEYRLFDVITYLAKGPLKDSKDDDGWTALHYASAKGDYRMAKLLLFLGCRPELKNDDGKTALELWPPNHEQKKRNELADIIAMRKRVSHCSTENRYLYLKNLELFAKKPNNYDIKIICT